MSPIPLAAIPAHYAAILGDDAPCLIHPEGTLSWGALERAANRRARCLAELGVGENDFVTLALPNGNRFFETSFAVWKLGATPHIVSPKLPAAELRIRRAPRLRLICLRSSVMSSGMTMVTG